MIGLPHKQGSRKWVDNNDSRARLGISEASCIVSPSQVAGQPSSDGGRQGRSGNLGYQYVMKHCIKGRLSSLWPHTLYDEVVEACLDVCCELEEGICSRVSGSEAVLIFSW